MSNVNVRHDLDATLVRANIETRVARHEILRIDWLERAAKNLTQYKSDLAAGIAHKNWIEKPTSVEAVNRMIDNWNERELTYYSKVRVIELPQEGNRFILVYGDADDAIVTEGTGPFESFEKAAAWFFNFGR